MAKKQGRGNTKNVFFSNAEMNYTILRALTGVYADGANVGEILHLVQNTQNNDIETFVKNWVEFAQKCENEAVEASKNGNFQKAKANFLKAANYYKSALVSLNCMDKRHREIWQCSVECFENAGKLFEIPVEKLNITLNDKHLPCYFIPSSSEKPCPVLFLVTGGEGTNVESYFWAGAYALQQGYSVFLYEGNGNISTIYESGLMMTPDSEIPIGKALDVLCSRKDVDKERIALMGISFGGYLTSRAAVFDKRIKALIADSPLTNVYDMLAGVLPKFIFKLSDNQINFIKKRLMNYSDRATLDLLFWEGGVKSFKKGIEFLKKFSIEGLENQIVCPVLAIAGEGEGKEFEKQAANFMQKISSQQKTHKIFTNAEGAGAHCQADNHILMNEFVINWLNKVFLID